MVRVLPDDWDASTGGHTRVLVGHQFQTRDGGWYQQHQLYPGLGADIVLESITPARVQFLPGDSAPCHWRPRYPQPGGSRQNPGE